MDNIGDRNGRLCIIGIGEPIIEGNPPRTIKTYQCRCDCGKEKIVRANNFTKTKSCGCSKQNKTLKNMSGQRFERLMVIGRGEPAIYETDTYKQTNQKWWCVCDCDNIVLVSASGLICGHNVSCGCMRTERIIELKDKNRIYEPRIYSARTVWKHYMNKDENMIPFDQFMELSQMKCFYCGINPSNHYNAFITNEDKRSSEFSITNGMFSYNGLDRIDSDGYHTIDNVVPCCFACNRAKSYKSIDWFLDKIKRYQIKDFAPINIDNITLLDLPDNIHLLSSINRVYRKYNDTDLTLQEFYTLTQMECSYCLSTNVSCARNTVAALQTTRESSYFYYIGLDRLDSRGDHAKNNILPCCIDCNMAKSDDNINDFVIWMDRVQSFQSNNPSLSQPPKPLNTRIDTVH